MNRPPKPALVMLLWQFFFYVALPVPMLAFMAWAYRGEDTQYWLGFAATCVWGAGGFMLVHHVFGRGFRDEDEAAASARATGPTAALELLKLPPEFKGLALWAFCACLAAFILTFQTVELMGFPRTLTVTTAIWVVGTGVCWAIWARGGLRLRSADADADAGAGAARRSGAYREIELSRGTGDGEAERTLRWRVAKGRSVLEVLRDIVEGGFLPPLAAGERSWEVAVDGEPVALLTQSWTGSRWWPEPVWLVDPYAPFAGERIVFTRGEP